MVGFLDDEPPFSRYFPKPPHEYKPRCAGMGVYYEYGDTHFTFLALKQFQDLRTKDNIVTKDTPIAYMAEEIPRLWGAVSQEPLL